ncbi:MAG: DUF433 domain-containing protein [Chloroflexi bacterium]|nr:MAG: DUF433 domain-containing protein [Chloroflexota bacterium]
MARYALNLPVKLKEEASKLAKQQGISLNQFILWSVSEKVGTLRQSLDDPNFPQITYRRGESNVPTPVLSGTGIRVQTIVVCVYDWKMTPEEVAEQYDRPLAQINAAIAFYKAHKKEIDSLIAFDSQLTAEAGYA